MAQHTRKAAPAGAVMDPRFANFQVDPRFRLPSKKHTRIQLDKRFSRMLHDAEFSAKAKVDRYGRKLEREAGKKELERFYRIEGGIGRPDLENKAIRPGSLVADAPADEELDQADDDEEVRRELKRMDAKYDPARDGGFSSSEEEDSEDESADEAVLGGAKEEEELGLPYEADVPVGEVTSRLAVVNLDWDNVKATDLMVVAASFVPTDGRILDVSIYPSEFGRERLEREEHEGPPRELFANSKRIEEPDGNENGAASDSDEDARIRKQLLQEDEGKEYSSTALRAYQLERLRYYYAVITCSSTATAKALYDAMDGREYLSSANFFDLRFVPDETSFDNDKPRDSCTEVPNNYRPTEFVTDALTHSKVKLTWDADDSARKEVQKRAFSRAEVDENDLQAYIGSESSDDEVHDGADTEKANGLDKSKLHKAASLRAALGLPLDRVKSSKKQDANVPVGELQVTWTPGLSAPLERNSVFANEPEETTREKYIRKEKERKTRRRERAKAARSNEVITEPATAGPEVAKHASDSRQRADEQSQNGTDPFDDPFFEDPAVSSRAARRAHRSQKTGHISNSEAENATQRAELELLMAEDDGAAPGGVHHFDMRDIVKAEKATRRKKRKSNRAADDDFSEKMMTQHAKDVNEDPRDATGSFDMDVADPRFARLYDSHEFAIDPTNPRFKRTEAMNAVMEEGRRRRQRAENMHMERIEEDQGERGAPKGNKKRKIHLDAGIAANHEDIDKLVQRVKSRAEPKRLGI